MAVANLGAAYEAPRAGVPKLRSRIERLFRTFGQQIAPMLIERDFGDPVERGDHPSEQWAPGCGYHAENPSRNFRHGPPVRRPSRSETRPCPSGRVFRERCCSKDRLGLACRTPPRARSLPEE